MSWNDDIKKIIAIVPQIESLQKELSKPKKESHDYSNLAERLSKLEQAKPKKYDDKNIKLEIENLGATVSELYDDVLSIKRSESSTRTSQELAENFERELFIVKSKLDELKQAKPYDDRDLTERLSKLEQFKPQKYDDKWVKDEIKNIKSKLITPYDDKKIKLEIKKLADSIPQKYNDSEIKKEIKALSEIASRKYDDSAIKKELQLLRKSMTKTYDDSKIKKEIEQVKSSIPKAYDDTEVKTEVSQLIEHCESQSVTIDLLSKECGKINELLNVINNRDKTIKDLKLDLKRAESSARSCEELMLNMERKVNELSARLNNGN